MDFIVWLKQRLTLHGFFHGALAPGETDELREALRSFEKARGFPVDGTADNKVVDALRNDPLQLDQTFTKSVISISDKRMLVGVHPDLVRVYGRMQSEFKGDFQIRITCGVRTLEEQRKNVARGVSWTMKSRHIPSSNQSRLSEAIDLAPYFGTLPRWDWPYFYTIAAAMKAAAKHENIPIVWGGDWSKNKDGPHFELDRKKYK